MPSLVSLIKLRSIPSLGLIAISRCFRKAVGWSPVKEVAISFADAQLRLTAEGGDGLIFWKEVAEQNPYASLEEHRGAAVLVDAGANTGAVTCQLLMRNPEWQAICLEPHPATFARLERNVALNGLSSRVDCRQAAAGANSGTCEIEINPALSMATVKGSAFEAAAIASASLLVPQLTVDELLQSGKFPLNRPILLKIDVEGWEAEVMRGSLATLRMASKVAVECHTESLLSECRAMMEQAGLRTTEARFPNGLWILHGSR